MGGDLKNARRSVRRPRFPWGGTSFVLIALAVAFGWGMSYWHDTGVTHLGRSSTITKLTSAGGVIRLSYERMQRPAWAVPAPVEEPVARPATRPASRPATHPATAPASPLANPRDTPFARGLVLRRIGPMPTTTSAAAVTTTDTASAAPARDPAATTPISPPPPERVAPSAVTVETPTLDFLHRRSSPPAPRNRVTALPGWRSWRFLGFGGGYYAAPSAKSGWELVIPWWSVATLALGPSLLALLIRRRRRGTRGFELMTAQSGRRL